MGLLKKFFCIIILFSLLAAFFPLSSRAASTDMDIDFTHNPITFIDFENFLRKRQDTALLIIKKYNSSLFNTIKDRVINYNDFFYIAISKSSIEDTRAYVFRVYFYDFDFFTNGRVYSNGDYLTTSPLYQNFYPDGANVEHIEMGGYQTITAFPSYNTRYNFTFNLGNHSQDTTTSTTISTGFSMQAACYGYISDYAMKLFDNSTTDYNPKLNTINSNLSSLVTNTDTIITKLDTIKGAINNGSSTIANTIVSTHNLDNSNDNKNTNEIIDAINDNTNAISDIQVTNDNSDLINAINNGFSNLNSNNNTNKNQIVSAINNASEEIVDGSNNNTNTIVSNSNTNKDDIVEAIEGVSVTGGSGGITNSEYNQGVTAINDNNDYNTNRILDNQVTEEDADIFTNIDVPEFEDPLPNLTNTLNNFFDNITNSNIQSKSFNLPFKNMNLNFTLDYNTLYNNFFSKNTTFYNLYKALWWGLVGFYVYKKLRVFYNKCIAGEWDEVVTAFDDSDEVIGRSVK